MSRPRPLVLVMIATGVMVRVVIALTTVGLPYDVHSWEIVRAALTAAPGHVYSLTNPGSIFHWPYPPGFFPLALVMGWVADVVGGFTHVIRFPAIAADAVLVWLVWEGLDGRVSERMRIGAAALVAFGPVFITISGYAAQIDSVAIVPAVIALLVWERVQTGRRAWIAGLLIGLAAAIKTVPFAMVLALAPTARDRRELFLLVACAVAVPLVAFAPFYAVDAAGVRHVAHYAGSPGMGGLSLVLQPNMAARWLSYWVVASGFEQSVFINHAGVYNALILVAFAVYAWRFRPEPRLAAALLWLLVIALGSGFFFQYLVWGLPFFLLAGYVRSSALLQGLITAPMVIYYSGPWKAHSIVWVYVPLMLAVWACWVCGGAVLARRGAAGRRAVAS